MLITLTFFCLLGASVLGELSDWSEEVAKEREMDNEDYNLEMRYETAAKEEMNALSSWLLVHSDNESVKWFADLDPLCPPPALHHLNPALCDVPVCQTSQDCMETETNVRHSSRHKVCCYNGCTLTCTKRLPEAPAFDWLEGPSSSLGKVFSSKDSSGELFDLKDQKPKTHSLKQLRSHPEVVALPGGCLLTQRQYKELEGFKESPHIKKCYCDTGGVLCEVKSVLNHR